LPLEGSLIILETIRTPTATNTAVAIVVLNTFSQKPMALFSTFSRPLSSRRAWGKTDAMPVAWLR
jgi:hypothetical protein